MSIEDLLEVRVTSATKKEQSQTSAPTAITVITQDEIRRSGATNIPDILRTVPGVHVARLDANKWSVTIRGFSGRFANKLLVLVDGVVVYSPLFSGVYWEAEDIPLESIERIEVIRGPGGTLWGANAVNGVINIITSSAPQHTETLLSLRAGTEDRFRALASHSGPLNDTTRLSLYTQYSAVDDGAPASDADAHDAWQHLNAGVRLDWTPSDSDRFSFLAKQYASEIEETFEFVSLIPPRSRIQDEKSYYAQTTVSTRWDHAFSDDSDFQIHLYYVHWQTNSPLIEDNRDTVNLDWLHRIRLSSMHELVWGLGVRYVEDDIQNNYVELNPSGRSDWLASGFVQDEITLIEDKLRLILGLKIEHNDYTGYEFQPNIRAVWTPSENQTVWGSISRAVRTPSRAEDDVRLPYLALPGILVSLYGDRDIEAENLYAFELGYRVSPAKRFVADFALFLNHYDSLRSVELRFPRPGYSMYPPHWSVPFKGDNNLDARTYGAEASITWEPKDWWRLRLSYAYFDVDTDLHPKTIDIVSGTLDGDSPKHTASLRSSFDLSENADLDFTLRYVDDLPSLGIGEYITLDTRLGWRPKPGLEFALVGQNLFDGDRAEYASQFVNTLPTEVERSVYAQINWRF